LIKSLEHTLEITHILAHSSSNSLVLSAHIGATPEAREGACGFHTCRRGSALTASLPLAVARPTRRARPNERENKDNAIEREFRRGVREFGARDAPFDERNDDS
jgi:hypothetical protein